MHSNSWLTLWVLYYISYFLKLSSVESFVLFFVCLFIFFPWWAGDLVTPKASRTTNIWTTPGMLWKVKMEIPKRNTETGLRVTNYFVARIIYWKHGLVNWPGVVERPLCIMSSRTNDLVLSLLETFFKGFSKSLQFYEPQLSDTGNDIIAFNSQDHHHCHRPFTDHLLCPEGFTYIYTRL